MTASGRRRPAGVDALGLGAALLLIAALSVWFGAEPDEDEGPPDPALVVVLVDTSASAVALRTDARLQIARAVRAAAREAIARGDECAVVTYADVATRRFGPSSDAAALDEVLAARTVQWTVDGITGALSTDLDGACALALALLAEGERPPGRVVVLGDPVGTTGGPGLERLAAPGVAAVDLRPLGPVRGFDLAVEDVRAEARVPAGAPSTVAVDLALVGAPPAGPDPPRVRLDWELRASRATGIGIGEPPFLRAGSESVEAAAAAGGTARWTAALTLPATPPGTADLVVRARFVGADGGTLDDAFDVDDTGRARWIVGDPDRVLVVGPSGEAATRAARALGGRAFEGLDVRSAGIEELRTELARGPEPHVLVTIDVAHAELPADWLVPFVVERGGGWLHAAGYARLRSDGGRLAALDALEPDREPRTPRDVHFLIDSSGSMRGARWTRARAAIARLMPALGPKDRLSVRMFSLALGAPRVVFEPDPGEPAAERRVRFESALDSLRGIEPSGGSTDIAGSLATFLDHGGAGGGFARPPARGSRERVVVLLTDGYETVGLGDTVALRAKLEREDVRLVVLQVDESDDARRYLTRFLPPGESVRAVGELLGVYAILQAAVEGTEPLRGARLARSPAPVGAGRLGDVLRAVRDAVGPAGPLLDETVPARPTAGAGPVLDAVLDAVVEAPEDRTPEGRSTRPDDGGGARTVALAAAERGLGLSVGLAHPLVREGGTRGPTDLLARMGWAAPLLRAMAARRRAAGVDEVLRPASASIEGARIVVRDLPIELRGRAALEAELLEPGTIDAFGLVGEPVPVARVLFEPPVFAADAAGVRVARRPAGLDSVARGGRLLLRFADASLEASLELVADGPREVAALFDTRLDRASARRFPRREPPAEVGAMDDERERPAHATALLLAGAALVCAGAAGVALGNGRRAGTPSGSP